MTVVPRSLRTVDVSCISVVYPSRRNQPDAIDGRKKEIYIEYLLLMLWPSFKVTITATTTTATLITIIIIIIIIILLLLLLLFSVKFRICYLYAGLKKSAIWRTSNLRESFIMRIEQMV